jgi:NADPH:quinone reductase-like Zn-dependent oxidoreductase
MAAPTTMKAWTFTTASGGLEKNLTLDPSAKAPPLPKSPSVLVEVISASINPVDYKIPELPLANKLMLSYPASPGLDYCGRVVTATGSLKEGQKVFGRLDGPTKFGTCAQFIVAPEKGCIPLPDGVDADSGAAMGTAAMTAYQCLKKGGEKLDGKKVFINGGSGGTGTWGIQMGKAMGANITTSCSTGNVELCKSLGADEVIDYTKVDLVDTLKSKGQVFDIAVDNVGLPAALYKSSDAFLKPGAPFVQVGAGASITGTKSLVGRMMMPGFLGGGKRPFVFHTCYNDKEDFEQIGKWLAEKKIKAIFDQVFEWEDVPKAYENLKMGKAKGKIVVHVTKE